MSRPTLRHCQICGAKIGSVNWSKRKTKDPLCHKHLQQKHHFGNIKQQLKETT